MSCPGRVISRLILVSLRSGSCSLPVLETAFSVVLFLWVLYMVDYLLDCRCMSWVIDCLVGVTLWCAVFVVLPC